MFGAWGRAVRTHEEDVGHCLSLDALAGVYDEERALASGERP